MHDCTISINRLTEPDKTMKTAVLIFSVCLCLAIIYTRCASAQPDQCGEDKEACQCPNGETGICWNQKCEMCKPSMASRSKRALFPFPIRARCRSQSQCGSMCRCKNKYCCCPWHRC